MREPRFGGVSFVIRTEYHLKSPSAAHYILVGFVVLVAVVVVAFADLITGVVADQNHLVYRQAFA